MKRETCGKEDERVKTNTQQRRLKWDLKVNIHKCPPLSYAANFPFTGRGPTIATVTGPFGHDPFRPYFFAAKKCTFRPTNIDVSPKIYQVLFILSVNKRN